MINKFNLLKFHSSISILKESTYILQQTFHSIEKSRIFSNKKLRELIIFSIFP